MNTTNTKLSNFNQNLISFIKLNKWLLNDFDLDDVLTIAKTIENINSLKIVGESKIYSKTTNYFEMKWNLGMLTGLGREALTLIYLLKLEIVQPQTINIKLFLRILDVQNINLITDSLGFQRIKRSDRMTTKTYHIDISKAKTFRPYKMEFDKMEKIQLILEAFCNICDYETEDMTLNRLIGYELDISGEFNFVSDIGTLISFKHEHEIMNLVSKLAVSKYLNKNRYFADADERPLTQINEFKLNNNMMRVFRFNLLYFILDVRNHPVSIPLCKLYYGVRKVPKDIRDTVNNMSWDMGDLTLMNMYVDNKHSRLLVDRIDENYNKRCGYQPTRILCKILGITQDEMEELISEIELNYRNTGIRLDTYDVWIENFNGSHSVTDKGYEMIKRIIEAR